MVFIVFLIIAAWNLPLPVWLQVCLTVFGSLRALCLLADNFGKNNN